MGRGSMAVDRSESGVVQNLDSGLDYGLDYGDFRIWTRFLRRYVYSRVI